MLNIANQLIAKGEVEHPYLGIQMAMTPEIVETLNRESNGRVSIQTAQGVVIIGIANNSPAARAGMRTGDVIRQIDGRQIKTAEDVQQAVESSQIGVALPVAITRNGQNLTLSIRPSEFPTSAS